MATVQWSEGMRGAVYRYVEVKHKRKNIAQKEKAWHKAQKWSAVLASSKEVITSQVPIQFVSYSQRTTILPSHIKSKVVAKPGMKETTADLSTTMWLTTCETTSARLLVEWWARSSHCGEIRAYYTVSSAGFGSRSPSRHHLGATSRREESLGHLIDEMAVIGIVDW